VYEGGNGDNGGNCGGNGGDNVAESSSVGMDYWSGSSMSDFNSDCSGGGNTSMIGNMIGETVERVGCSFGEDLPSSISAESHAHNHRYPTQQECLPPMKRARMDCGPDRMSASIMEEDDSMMDTPSAPPCSSVAKKMGWNCINYKMNVDKMDGRRCCHVCSAEEDHANDRKECRVATTTEKSLHSHPSHAAASASASPAKSNANAAPRSRSLLTYFQPTKKNQSLPPPKTKNHQKRETPSLHHRVGTEASSNLSQCRYCDKPTCISCTRQCIRCQHRFCTFCTKVDYDSSVEERIMCFDCDYEYGGGNANNGEDGGDGDCDMMDL